MRRFVLVALAVLATTTAAPNSWGSPILLDLRVQITELDPFWEYTPLPHAGNWSEGEIGSYRVSFDTANLVQLSASGSSASYDVGPWQIALQFPSGGPLVAGDGNLLITLVDGVEDLFVLSAFETDATDYNLVLGDASGTALTGAEVRAPSAWLEAFDGRVFSRGSWSIIDQPGARASGQLAPIPEPTGALLFAAGAALVAAASLRRGRHHSRGS